MTAVLALAAALVAQGSVPPAGGCAERLLPPRPMAAAGLRDPSPADLIELRDFGDPGESPLSEAMYALSPDGRSIAVALRRASLGGNDYCYGILVVPLGGGPPRLVDVGGEPLMMAFDLREQADFPNGVVQSSLLAWSPDGRWIAYLRRDSGRTQLWRVRGDGSGAAAVTTGQDDVRSFAWDGNEALHFTVRSGAGRAEAARATEGLSGYHYDARFETQASALPGLPITMPYERRRFDLRSGTVTPAPPEAGEAGVPHGAIRWSRGTKGALAWSEPRWPDRYYRGSRMRVRLNGREIACAAAACLDRIHAFWWRSDGTLLFLHDRSMPEMGLLALYAWRPGKGAPRQVFETDSLLMGCRLIDDASLLCAEEAATQPRRIVRIETHTGRVAPVFDPNPEWAGIRRGTVERFAVHAPGAAPTFARLLLPPGHRPGQRHPMVIVQYQSRGFLRGGTGDEYPMPLLAARGYAVLSFQKPLSIATDSAASDFESFRKISVEGWKDRRSINAALLFAVDHAVATGAVDPDRIAITGLSDGAMSAAFALLNGGGRRFRAAIMSSCCEDPATIRFATGPAFLASLKHAGYPAPGRDDAAFWKGYSIAASARDVSAPLLIQAPDSEFRLAIETVETLKETGVPVELYVFPNEYHIKWQPKHRDAIYRRGIAWLDFWMLGRLDPERPEEIARWQALRRAWLGASSP